ncbi:NAD(P)-dependent oxidoreductase [Vibrio sp. TH_r3]|uniref:precorrin-2 dehydrogenase/sirohydrochlorin ferrochelatase family protein n=1 Tax=Vibrio sp. TH_r3 TaxID=3082084 RepID=UPI002952CFF1|nr:NAD(P)-dependent oxidoreductase [Vibrio sp. TH_r3]MDV7104387.1 NAD(P)-dependent oxidoreductase [Vibrio sp. TH_r3]
MQYFPLFLDLNNKPVLVVGGGDVASRKVDALLRANARVTVVSPEVSSYLKDCADKQLLVWVQSQYRDDYTEDYIQVWATTNNPDLNYKVHKDAKKRGILVNVVDDKPYCDFITPSMINRGKVQIAISSGGASPVLIRNLREKIESVLPQNTGLLTDFASSKRTDIKKTYQTVDERRRFWEDFFANPEVELTENIEDLEAIYTAYLQNCYNMTVSRFWVEFGENVELLSIRTLRIMQQSELVLYPETCPYPFIDLCRRDAERFTYSDNDHLGQILDKHVDSDLKKVCIFIPKNKLSESQTMAKMALADTLLRIVD